MRSDLRAEAAYLSQLNKEEAISTGPWESGSKCFQNYEKLTQVLSQTKDALRYLLDELF